MEQRDGWLLFLSPGNLPVLLGNVVDEIEWLAEDGQLLGESEDVAALDVE